MLSHLGKELTAVEGNFFSKSEFVRAINVCADETMVIVLHSQQNSLVMIWLSTIFSAVT